MIGWMNDRWTGRMVLGVLVICVRLGDNLNRVAVPAACSLSGGGRKKGFG